MIASSPAQPHACHICASAQHRPHVRVINSSGRSTRTGTISATIPVPRSSYDGVDAGWRMFLQRGKTCPAVRTSGGTRCLGGPFHHSRRPWSPGTHAAARCSGGGRRHALVRRLHRRVVCCTDTPATALTPAFHHAHFLRATLSCDSHECAVPRHCCFNPATPAI